MQKKICSSAVLLLLLIACGGGAQNGTSPVQPSALAETRTTVNPHIASVVAAEDRTEEDRALDAGRKPGEVFSFFGVQPGWKVAELFAGGGYSTEILARIVGASGSVLAQNSPAILERFARVPLDARLARLQMPTIHPIESELGAPFAEDVRDLDAVIFILTYHDAVWQGVDRNAMNRAVFAALKPGGVYGIVDHAAAPGHGIADSESLHRIEESVVVEEVLAAGFRLDARSDVLRNEDDTYDWSTSPRVAGERRGTSDRFVLRFVRP